MLKWGMIVLIFSLVFGGLCKLAGEAYLSGLESIDTLVDTLSTIDFGDDDLNQEAIAKEFHEGYLWPISRSIQRSFTGGVHDNLFAEKRLMRVLSKQLIAAVLQILTAAGGLIILASGIK